MHRRVFLSALGALGVSGIARATGHVGLLLAQAATQARTPDVIFVPTPNEVVNKMLEMAKVSASDVVYDLGCGDGRIVITAAQRHGARGVGIDIDPDRIREATDNVRSAKVTDKVKFIQGDLFEADISEATVVTLYLLTELNLKLRPKLMKDLRPGTRVVSHAFAMGDWKPERTEHVNGSSVYLWRIPPRKA
jgi:SAM-dependent methyltransferase